MTLSDGSFVGLDAKSLELPRPGEIVASRTTVGGYSLLERKRVREGRRAARDVGTEHEQRHHADVGQKEKHGPSSFLPVSHLQRAPLLFRMATEPRFLEPLALIPRFVTYAAVLHDILVPYESAALRRWNPYNLHPRASGILKAEEGRFSFVTGSTLRDRHFPGPPPAAASPAFWRRDPRSSLSGLWQAGPEDSIAGASDEYEEAQELSKDFYALLEFPVSILMSLPDHSDGVKFFRYTREMMSAGGGNVSICRDELCGGVGDRGLCRKWSKGREVYMIPRCHRVFFHDVWVTLSMEPLSVMWETTVG